MSRLNHLLCSALLSALLTGAALPAVAANTSSDPRINTIFITKEAQAKFFSYLAEKPTTGELLIDVASTQGCKYKNAKEVQHATIKLEGSDVLFAKFFEPNKVYKEALKKALNICV